LTTEKAQRNLKDLHTSLVEGLNTHSKATTLIQVLSMHALLRPYTHTLLPFLQYYWLRIFTVLRPFEITMHVPCIYSNLAELYVLSSIRLDIWNTVTCGCKILLTFKPCFFKSFQTWLLHGLLGLNVPIHQP
jgi:hypothetical protein